MQMQQLVKQVSTTYYIAHNGKDVFHHAILDAGHIVATGQPYLETFKTEKEWESRAGELGFKIQRIEDMTREPLADVIAD